MVKSLACLVLWEIIPSVDFTPLPLGTRTGQSDWERKIEIHRDRREGGAVASSWQSPSPGAGVAPRGVRSQQDPWAPPAVPGTPPQPSTGLGTVGACLLLRPLHLAFHLSL